MEIFIGIIFVAAIWMLLSTKKELKYVKANNAADWADSWFKSNQIDTESINFSSYEDPALVQNEGAVVVAGTGVDTSGQHIGFAVEVISGRGVVRSEIFKPFGIATWHRHESLTAKLEGITLIDALLRRANRG